MNKTHIVIIGAALLLSGTAFYIYTDAQVQADKRAAEAKAQAEQAAESERRASMYRAQEEARAQAAAPVSARPVPWALRGRFPQRDVAEEQLDELRRANEIAEQSAYDRRREALFAPMPPVKVYEPPAYKPIEFPARPDYNAELQRQAVERVANELQSIRRDQFYDNLLNRP